MVWSVGISSVCHFMVGDEIVNSMSLPDGYETNNGLRRRLSCFCDDLVTLGNSTSVEISVEGRVPAGKIEDT